MRNLKNEREVLLELVMKDRGWVLDYSKLKKETLFELAEIKDGKYPLNMLKKAYKEMGWDITDEEIKTLILDE
ncbi:hypothetical protein [Croceitalea rosinachiae]|uniref:Uncharacterized protein n=1 Tax=Croceitalea rosinachiae TaxID=3075596 RepID=A0ABU3ACW1_9FLAO|nr:hypothetical protein [Croceitalea sp. F388]MDT0608016.1 hypothetical protein [Croceitalea sp. F388]